MVYFRANQIMGQILEDSEQILAFSAIFEGSISLGELRFSDERAEFLKKMASNSYAVISELPEDQRASALIFTPSLLTSFDLGRDELAISFFLDHQRDPGSDSLSGLLRLASLSCQGGETIYQSEAANLLGITLACRTISLGQIEEGFMILKERGLILDQDIIATTKLITRRAEEMKWVSSLLAETQSSEGSRSARATLDLIYNHKTDQIDALFKLSKKEKLWVFAKLYERFCDATLPEATRISAITALHDVTTSLKNSIEEVLTYPLGLVVDYDLPLDDLRRIASDLIEEDIFGGGLLLSIAAQRLEDKNPDRKRRILNFLAVAWEYAPTSSNVIEGYCASALELGHINLSYLKANDSSFKGERPETFNDFCRAILNYDKSKSVISPLLPTKRNLSVFRVFEGDEWEIKELLAEVVCKISGSIKVLCYDAVYDRALQDLKSLNLFERDRVIDRLIDLKLISDNYNRKQKSSEHRINLLVPIYISHIADRVIPEGTGLTYRELRQRVLEVGRTCPANISLHMTLSAAGKPYFQTILSIASSEDGPVVEIKENRAEILEHLLKEVRDSKNAEEILFFISLHLDQFTEAEVAEAFLNVSKDIYNEGYSITDRDETRFENLIEILPRIGADLPASKEIANFLLGTIQSSFLHSIERIKRERTDARKNKDAVVDSPDQEDLGMLRTVLDFVKKSGFTDPSIRFMPYHDAGLIRRKSILKIVEISSDEVKISLLSELFNRLPFRIEIDPRGNGVSYSTPQHVSFIDNMLRKFGLEIVLGVLDRSSHVNDQELRERVRRLAQDQ